MDEPVVANPWDGLRRFTPARIALGRAGVSLPTRPLLAFQLAHACARDAVHLPLDRGALREQFESAGHVVIDLHSAAADRGQYLQRPDLGRRLDEPSRRLLADFAGGGVRGFDVAFVVADGLSALAVNRHAAPLLAALRPALDAEGWRIAPVALVEQGRVAVGDEVGSLLGAGIAVVLIGERPGLSSPDSLGIYLTHGPRPGRVDADRNCISNVRPQGLGFAAAAHRLIYLLRESRARQLSGVSLKDEAGPVTPARPLAGPSGNFLVGEADRLAGPPLHGPPPRAQ